MTEQSTVLEANETIRDRIVRIRGERVLLAADLARFYGLTTSRLNEQVRRNRDRFPMDFAFTLTEEEKDELIANCDQFNYLKHSSVLPMVFTEHGAIMAASVLNTPRAVQMSVFVVRAFVALRRSLSDPGLLAAKLREIDQRLAGHDESIRVLAQVVEELVGPGDVPPPRRIGFRSGD
jgi:hypothetical protein